MSADERSSTPALSPRALLVAGGIFVVATLLVFGDVLLAGGTRVVSAPGNDLETIFFHWHEFGFGELRKGNLALWNPHVYSGAPYFGAFQPALLYPPNWLNLVLPTAVAINVGVALHFIAAGLWTYLWAAHRRLAPAACVLGGLVFMFCGPHFLQVLRGHLPNLRTIVWAPLILLAIDGAFAAPALSWILLGAFAVAMQILAGHVQETLYTGVIVAVYALLCAARASRRLAALGCVLAMYVAAAALAAVQLGGGVGAVAGSIRSQLPYELASTFAFPPENLLTLVLPGIFGDMVTVPYWGRWTLSEMSLFIGVAPFVLALYGACCGRRETRRFSTALVVLTLLLAFGAYTPLFRPLYDHVPLVASFRGTTKFAFLAGAFLAMLAALGLDRLLRATHVPRWPALVAAFACVACFVAAFAIDRSAAAGSDGVWARALAAIDTSDVAFRYYPVARGGTFARRAGEYAAGSLAIAGVTFFAVAVLWIGARRRRALAYGLIVLGCAELLVYARHTLLTFAVAPVEQKIAALRALQQRSGGDFRVQTLNPYVAMSAHAYDIWGYDPMLPSRYADLVARTQGVPPAMLMVTPLRVIPPLFGMLRLRYVVYADEGGVRVVPTGFAELPRATLVPRWRVVRDRDAALDAVVDPAFDPGREVLLEREPEEWLRAETTDASALAGGASGGVRVADLSTDSVEIWVESSVPAILVVSDGYAAGWKVTAIDQLGAPSYDVLPADYVLRGVPLAAGRHHLRMEYRPTAFLVGRAISIVALIAYACAAGFVACRAAWFPIRANGS